MIKKDQPKIFKNKVVCGISSIEDGNMKLGIEDNEITHKNIDNFLKYFHIDSNRSVLCQINYDTDCFCRYYDVKSCLFSHYADALVTKNKGIALYLPLADCVGAICFDNRTNSLMISHLGRHSLEQYGGVKCIKYFCNKYNLESSSISVWLSPSPSEKNYPLRQFNDKSLAAVTKQQLILSGIPESSIESSNIDNSILSNGYFSHSEFLKNNRKTDGRYMIFAQLK